ncbi:MAG: hypothetical protein M5U35_05345 [Roseovarius sp.]|nr:hypothetical protein [Roseovarius sp.]
MRHGTRQLSGERARHGACHPPLAWFCAAAWPDLSPPLTPIWDSGNTWLATMRHVARDGECRLIGCATALETSDMSTDIPYYCDLFPNRDQLANPGDAVIYKPLGGIHAGPIHQEKELHYSEIDVKAARSLRRKLDANGHYARSDVFSLSVDREKQTPVEFTRYNRRIQREAEIHKRFWIPFFHGQQTAADVKQQCGIRSSFQ